MSARTTPPHALLLLDIPPSTLCGLDLVSFTTTAQFQGIKQVPTGWHFIYTSATTSVSIRHGTWLHVPVLSWLDEPVTTAAAAAAAAAAQQQQDEEEGEEGEEEIGEEDKTRRQVESRTSPRTVIVKRWDGEREEVVPEEDEREVLRWKANLGRIWNERLTPYRFSAGGEEAKGKEDWTMLTDCITRQLLDRIMGGGDRSGMNGDEVTTGWRLTSVSSAPQDLDEIPGLDTVTAHREMTCHGRSLNFLPIDLKRTWRAGAIGRERTQAAQDRSWALGEVLRHGHPVKSHPSHQSLDERPPQGKKTKTKPDGNDDDDGIDEIDQDERELLGEMQFSFLMILTLANYSCMEQWKRILRLILTCRAAVRGRPGLFARVLRLLKVQLRHCDDVEGGLFELHDDNEGRTSLLPYLLKTFRRGLDDTFGSSDGHDQGKDDAPSSSMSRSASEREPAEKLVRLAYADLESFVKGEFGWELGDSYVRRGLLQLEDGEEVELEMDDLQDEDERGEYAPVVVDIDELSTLS